MFARHVTSTLLRSSRRMATDAGEKLPPPPARLKAAQEKFQMDDDVPVHFKAGFRDRLLFTVTCTLGAVGLTLALHNTYKLIVK